MTSQWNLRNRLYMRQYYSSNNLSVSLTTLEINHCALQDSSVSCLPYNGFSINYYQNGWFWFWYYKWCQSNLRSVLQFFCSIFENIKYKTLVRVYHGNWTLSMVVTTDLSSRPLTIYGISAHYTILGTEYLGHRKLYPMIGRLAYQISQYILLW